MSSWEWTAVDARGRREQGLTDAPDEQALDRELERRGLVLVTVRRSDPLARERAERVPAGELAGLTARMATLVRAGVPLVEGLEGLAEREEHRGVRALLAGLARDLRGGASLSQALEKRPAVFPTEYRAAVHAGESSGALARVLDGLAAHLESKAALWHRAQQALVQPLVLAAALLGLVVLLVCFLLPRVSALYGANQAALPVETRTLLALSGFLREHGYLLVVFALAFVAVAWRLRGEPRVRRFVHGRLFALPRLGRVLRAIATARFASTASVLHGAGCDALTLLTVSGEASGNAAFLAATERAAERVARGALFSEALSPEPCVDRLLVQVVAVGEKSGALAPTLAEAARRYEADVPRELARFFGFLEPALLVTSGLVVAWILLAALLPIFDLYEHLA
ncbi:MAG: type II secretion system F family protein [Planctomycetes bacterium]|nr:type II secretion system F family protein [Planctomycetota bacterium]